MILSRVPFSIRKIKPSSNVSYKMLNSHHSTKPVKDLRSSKFIDDRSLSLLRSIKGMKIQENFIDRALFVETLVKSFDMSLIKNLNVQLFCSYCAIMFTRGNYGKKYLES